MPEAYWAQDSFEKGLDQNSTITTTISEHNRIPGRLLTPMQELADEPGPSDVDSTSVFRNRLIGRQSNHLNEAKQKLEQRHSSGFGISRRRKEFLNFLNKVIICTSLRVCGGLDDESV